MATGRLGALDIDGSSNTVDTNYGVYTVPASTKASINISVCSRTASSAKVRVALIDGAIGDVADEDYIEYDVAIPLSGVLERTGIILEAAGTVLMRSDTAGVNMVITGVEEAV